eukprot:TRINITY_DN9276_c0_g6_i1.p1 TRINITY_DN9276_c0_g6~~TRINITY_DN9276_c0_g6_i1.p1  ORF type:complete len:831 (+),score=234.46 TRINITY_DN9276_c0_g6_i1:159-2651(+)
MPPHSLGTSEVERATSLLYTPRPGVEHQVRPGVVDKLREALSDQPLVREQLMSSLEATLQTMQSEISQLRSQAGYRPKDPCTLWEAENGAPPAAPKAELVPGAYVRLDQLKSRPSLNGRRGMLLDFDEDSGRWNVIMSDSTGVRLKPDNCVLEWQGRIMPPTDLPPNLPTSPPMKSLTNGHAKTGFVEDMPADWFGSSLASREDFVAQQLALMKEALTVGHEHVLDVLERGLVAMAGISSPGLQKTSTGQPNGVEYADYEEYAPRQPFCMETMALTSTIGPMDSMATRFQHPLCSEDIGDRATMLTDLNGNGDCKMKASCRSMLSGDDDTEGGRKKKEKKENRIVGLGSDADDSKGRAAAAVEHAKTQTGGKSMQGKVFADATAMKDKVREAIMKKPYSVTDYYWESGFCQFVARNNYFEQLTLLVIAANALWIAVDTEFNHADVLLQADMMFVVAENTFCLFFFFEWSVRFGAFKKKVHGLKDAWFVFDSTLVFIMVMETWVMTVILLIFGGESGAGFGDASILRLFRLLRLTRMARMARLLHAMPELMILIKAIFVAFRSVFFTVCLLMIVIYIFAIAFVQLTKETTTGQEYFDGVLGAMGTLLLAGNLPDHETFVSKITRANPLWGAILMAFVFLAPLTIMGMLAGVLVEVVGVVSSVEKETMVVNYVTEQLHKMLKEVDEDENATLNREEFQGLVVRPDAARMMTSVGVDVIALADFCDYLFTGSEHISFSTFMEMVLQLRGSNQATVKDIVDMRKFMRQELIDVFQGGMDKFEAKVAKTLESILTKGSANARDFDTFHHRREGAPNGYGTSSAMYKATNNLFHEI